MDKNVTAVVERMLQRADVGLRKYGVTTERTDLSTVQWLTHLQEELMDSIIYIEKLTGKSSVIDVIKYGKISFLIQAGKVVTTEYTHTEK